MVTQEERSQRNFWENPTYAVLGACQALPANRATTRRVLWTRTLQALNYELLVIRNRRAKPYTNHFSDFRSKARCTFLRTCTQLPSVEGDKLLVVLI